MVIEDIILPKLDIVDFALKRFQIDSLKKSFGRTTAKGSDFDIAGQTFPPLKLEKGILSGFLASKESWEMQLR